MEKPTNPAETHDLSFGLLISMIRTELVRALEAELQTEGVDLRFTQFLALKRLALDGPMCAGELARAVDHDAGAMTRVIDQLETKGYVRRQPHEQDRRSMRIAVTDAGMATWRHIAKAHERTLERAQQELSPDERAQLMDSLERVLAALRAAE
ncbi:MULTISPECIES: MarR family transcriptional regulator [Oleiagrimonas]|uniref:MarR family transcriptional regulator n=1 Tax=Oleiagrimonas citrea TaxID=1665687 RepID=A0A846ZR57_9GAMM|nr:MULTISPECIES: MarR family transcriptional regulator [Oleiagrimonas]NKZ39881.1 MarR family transcriptional regulator [Oleiagrimonas citrea]RAP57026.1 MarR family transcriptional regulator [Oleiagrimonas sp. MCCC 1A03011]